MILYNILLWMNIVTNIQMYIPCYEYLDVYSMKINKIINTFFSNETAYDLKDMG